MQIIPSQVRRTAAVSQQLLMAALPHGGQRVARRNAWASMAADAALTRARREAAEAMDWAIAQAELPAPRQASAGGR